MHILLDLGSNALKMYEFKKIWSKSFFLKKSYKEDFLSPEFFKFLSDILIENKVSKIDLLISGSETFVNFYQSKNTLVEEQELEQYTSFYPNIEYNLQKNQWGSILSAYNIQTLERMKTFFSSLGIKLNKITHHSLFILENFKSSKSNYYLIDFGHESIRILFFVKNKLFFYKKIYLGGKHLINEIQKKISVTYEEGKILKEDVHYYSDDLRDLVEEFYSKIEEVLSYYIQPNYDVFVTGNEFENKFLKRKFNHYLYIPTEEIFSWN